MNLQFFLTIIVTSIILVNNVVKASAGDEDEGQKQAKVLCKCTWNTPNYLKLMAFSLVKKILARRREEQHLLQKNLDSGKFKYEQKFRLLQVAVDKVFEVLFNNFY